MVNLTLYTKIAHNRSLDKFEKAGSEVLSLYILFRSTTTAVASFDPSFESAGTTEASIQPLRGGCFSRMLSSAVLPHWRTSSGMRRSLDQDRFAGRKKRCSVTLGAACGAL